MQTTRNRQRRGGASSRRGPADRNRRNRPRSTSGGGSQRRFNRGSGGGRSSGGGIRTSRGRVLPSFDPSQFINKNPVELKEEVYTPTHKFSTFGLNPRLVKTINSMGLETPSPIQDQVIPEILNGKDVIGLAETGTGKTAAFLIPLIEKTLNEYNRQTLVLTPTRELAIQIEDELRKLTKSHKLFSTVCVGGANIGPQLRGLKRKNHFIIGTPGRIQDLIDRGAFRPEHVTTVVLDEADRMLDMGFINDMRAILAETPADRETLFFSATMDEKSKGLVHDFMNSPVTISVKKRDVTNSIAQDVIQFIEAEKFDTLVTLLKKDNFKRVIIFTAMKHSAKKLEQQLDKFGIKAESIHGNKTHGQRQRALGSFKNGKSQVLVATDVAARGIHVNDISHVINYDLPGSFEDYVHRIGRTGRGTKRGEALTFVPSR